MEQLNLKNRPDIKRILDFSDTEFETWHKATLDATMRLVHDYGLFANIPHLGYEDTEENMSALVHVREHREALLEGLRYLNALKKHRDKRHSPEVARAGIHRTGEM